MSKKVNDPNLKRKIRYRAIVKKTNDPKLARKYRDYSDARILKELSIKIPKSLPKIKPKIKLRKVVYTRKSLVERGIIVPKKRVSVVSPVIEPEISRGGRGEKLTEAQKKLRLIEKYNEIDYNSTDKFEARGHDTAKNRRDNWRNWSRDEFFPYSVEVLAHKVNEMKGLDIDANYGWYVAYEMYVNNQTLEYTLSYAVYDKFTDMYHDNRLL